MSLLQGFLVCDLKWNKHWGKVSTIALEKKSRKNINWKSQMHEFSHISRCNEKPFNPFPKNSWFSSSAPLFKSKNFSTSAMKYSKQVFFFRKVNNFRFIDGV